MRTLRCLSQRSRQVEVGGIDAMIHPAHRQYAGTEGATQFQQPRQWRSTPKTHDRKLTRVNAGLATGLAHGLATIPANSHREALRSSTYDRRRVRHPTFSPATSAMRMGRVPTCSISGLRPGGNGRADPRPTWSAARPTFIAAGAFRRVDEIKQCCTSVLSRACSASACWLGQGQAGDIQSAVGALDRADAFGVEAAALEAFAVDAAGAAQGFGGDKRVGRHITADQHTHAKEGMGADAAELVHAREATGDHPVADFHMACER